MGVLTHQRWEQCLGSFRWTGPLRRAERWAPSGLGPAGKVAKQEDVSNGPEQSEKKDVGQERKEPL